MQMHIHIYTHILHVDVDVHVYEILRQFGSSGLLFIPMSFMIPRC